MNAATKQMVSVPRSLREADLDQMLQSAERAATFLRTLANADRLMLLCQLVEGEKNVTELSACTGIMQPTLSQQIGVLRKDGLIEQRREGRNMYYRVSDPVALKVLDVLYRAFCGA